MSDIRRVDFNNGLLKATSQSIRRDEMLQGGVNYAQGTLLIREAGSGILRMPTASEITEGEGIAFFLSIDAPLADRGDSLWSVLVAGEFWQETMVLPEGVSLETMVGKMRLIDVLRMQGLHADSYNLVYFRAGGNE